MSSLEQENNKIGFGTFKGVFIPNVTMMFGVILFLRLGVILGNVGIWEFILIVAVSLGIMVITSLSIATVVTNMNVGGGGAYYLISRSLGIELGGAIGIALVISQVVSLTLCTSGFAYSFVELFPQMNIHQVEFCTLVILTVISLASADLALRTQTLIFCLLFLSLGAVALFSAEVKTPSAPPFFSSPLGFWTGFAMFYPALTGIEAGMAMSGNLKNPSRALSLGNVVSILIVALVYIGMGIFLWNTFGQKVLDSQPLILITSAKYPSLIYLGIWSATLSSALGNLIGGPRMFQTIAEDGIVHEIFSRTFGKHKEPRFAIALVFIAAVLLNTLTTMDQILPILTMFCLLTYGTLNFVAGMAELIHGPSWRPSFRSPWQLSLTGAGVCFFVMLMIDPLMAFISVSIIIVLYILLRKKSLEASFEDFRESIIFFFSRRALYHLSETEENLANWLPQIMMATRSPLPTEKAITMANSMTERSGMLTVASIVPEVWEDLESLGRTKQQYKDWLFERSIECLIEVQAHADFYEGVCTLIKSYGIGPIQPNTVMLNISHPSEEDLSGIVSVSEAAKLYGKNVILFLDTDSVSAEKFKVLDSSKKAIDIWWDPEHRQSFDLMISYIMALRTSPIWRRRQVTLWAQASDKSQKRHLEKYFRSLVKALRIRFKIRVVVEKEGNATSTIEKYSKNSDVIFFPLQPIADSSEEYKEYVEKLLCTVPQQVLVLAICSYDSIDHKEVYLP